MPRFSLAGHKIFNEFGAYVLSTRNRHSTPVAEWMGRPQESHNDCGPKCHLGLPAGKGIPDPQTVRIPMSEEAVH